MKIREVILQSRNLSAQRSFYADALGLSLIEGWHHSVALQCGVSRLVFWDAPGDEFEGQYHFAFHIALSRFEEALEWVRTHTPIIRSDGQERFYSRSWEADRVYFFDPAGNVVEFIARDLPDPVDGPFSGKNILSVVEIGLGARNVSELAAQLQEQTGLPVYRDSIGDDFGALGDRNGLLILSKEGRIWFPESGKLAGLFPLTVTFESDNSRRLRIDSPPYPAKVVELETSPADRT